MSDIEEKSNETIEIPSEESVEIRLDDDPKVETKVSRKSEEPDEREQQLIEIRQQYEDSKKREQAERYARQQAEQYAFEQAQKAQYAQADAQDNRLRTVLNAIEATEQSASNSERAYADAVSVGDHVAAAKAQRLMAQAEAHLLHLQNAKSEMEEYLNSVRTEGRVQEPQRPRFDPQPQQPVDPVEAVASQLSPKSAAWVRAHPETVKQIDKLHAAHQAATKLQGLVSESPEYFRYVEESLGLTPSKSSKKAMASAPVSNSSSMSSSRSSGNGNTMVLSPAEVEQAVLNEPELPRDKALEVYARNKAALIREGKLSA